MEPVRLELPVGWAMGSVNAYLFTRPEVALVDTGLKTDEGWDALVAGLATHGIAIGDISRVVITHPHVDHLGLAGRITAESDATIWICDLGAPWLLCPASMWAERIAYYREAFLPRLGLAPDVEAAILQGMELMADQVDPVPASRLVTFRQNGVLQLGGRAWQSIHTPGHAEAQTVFYQSETRRLISADMLLAVAPAPVIEHPASKGSERRPALPRFLQSLDLIEELDVDTVYPGHGRPFQAHRQVIARQRERIASRVTQCLEFIRAGQSTVPQLLESMYAHQPPAARVAGLWMLIGYLDLLLARGLAREDLVEGVCHYRPV